jgi:dTDP-4-amino-4,6-dideoxygalactose transaminase
LRVKLRHLDEWNETRRLAAGWYRDGLGEVCACPRERDGAYHVYHLFVIRTPERDGLREHLEQAGVTSLMHYPIPVHLQDAYRELGHREGDLPATEAAAGEILSLPMHALITREGVGVVCERVREYLESREGNR